MLNTITTLNVCLFMATTAVSAQNQAIRQCVELRNHDRPLEALACFRAAIQKDPRDLRAHAEYVGTKTYDLNRFDEVVAEYEALAKKEPDNPIYLIALIRGQGLTSAAGMRVWYESIARSAHGTGWGHFAEAKLSIQSDPAEAAASTARAIALDPTLREAYYLGIFLRETKLHDLDGALAIAVKMSVQSDTDLHASGLYETWRLRLLKQKDSPQAVAQVRQELRDLTAVSRELAVLAVARDAYSRLLNDPAGAAEVKAAILQIDPQWYTERGLHMYSASSTESGVQLQVVAVNHEAQILSQLYDMDSGLPPADKIELLRNLLPGSESPNVRMLLYQRLFRTAEQADDRAAMVEYGERYREAFELLYPGEIDASLLAKIALARADRSIDLARAIDEAQKACDATANLPPWQKPRNTDANHRSSDADRQRLWQSTRALALEARGWTLCQTGQCSQGEPLIRQAVEMRRSEGNLLHLSAALEKLNRTAEADEIQTQARDEWLASLRRRMRKEPPQDFQANALDGRSFHLASLKGKVVLVNFWATWCSPCVQEMPLLAEMYEKYKDRGLELLAISVDEDAAHHKVTRFAEEHKLTFPVIFDNGVQKLYKVSSYPTSLLIDREGMLRLRFNLAERRSLDALLAELLK